MCKLKSCFAMPMEDPHTVDQILIGYSMYIKAFDDQTSPDIETLYL